MEDLVIKYVSIIKQRKTHISFLYPKFYDGYNFSYVRYKLIGAGHFDR